MIKKLTSAIWMVYIILTVCQSAMSQKWSFGAHAGVTHAKMLWPTKPDIINNTLAFDFPETRFRTSIGAGIIADYKFNDKWYSPIQLDIYKRRFAVGTGIRGSVATFDAQGNWISIQTEFLEYQVNQFALGGGIGYSFIDQLSIELQPYIHTSLSKQKIKIGDVIDWRVDDNFKQDFDFGISGYLRGNIDHIYLKAGYQYGLREIEEFSVIEANGGFLYKAAIRNTMLLAIIGYKF